MEKDSADIKNVSVIFLQIYKSIDGAALTLKFMLTFLEHIGFHFFHIL